MNSPIRLAINGYGRIGRCFARALYESPLRGRYRLVAINEPADLESMVYLTRFDSTHGAFRGSVEQSDDGMIIEGDPIQVSHARDPEGVAWSDIGVDVLIECSGQYSERRDLERFLHAGCPRVLLSHPGASAEDVDHTVVYGVNHESISGRERLLSNASCTTNAIVPVLDELHRGFGVEHVFLTTLHSVMNDQPLIDGYHHSDLRRTRSAMQSIVPVATGLAQGVERLLPYLRDRVQAKAIRVPTLNVSVIDLVVNLSRDVTVASLATLMQEAAQRAPTLFAVASHPHASVDFNHNPRSAIIDGTQIRTNGDGFANLLVWFDNEWGFANRMLDTLDVWCGRH